MTRFRPSPLSYGAPVAYDGVLDAILPSALTLPVKVGRSVASATEGISSALRGAGTAAGSFLSALPQGLSTAASSAAQTYAAEQQRRAEEEARIAAERARLLWTVGAVVAAGLGLWLVSRAVSTPRAAPAAPAKPAGG